MTMTDQAALIRQYFDAQVATPLSVAVRHDNDPRDPPKNVTWVLFSVLDGTTTQVECGAGSDGNTHRGVGAVIASIFTPRGAGDVTARAIAELMKTKFRSKEIGQTSFATPSVKKIGNTGAHWQLNVTVPFMFDEIASGVPLPVGAYFDESAKILVIRFSTQLTPITELATAEIHASTLSLTYAHSGAAVLGDVLIGRLAIEDTGNATNTCGLSNDSDEITGINGAVAQSFTGFPLEVV